MNVSYKIKKGKTKHIRMYYYYNIILCGGIPAYCYRYLILYGNGIIKNVDRTEKWETSQEENKYIHVSVI